MQAVGAILKRRSADSTVNLLEVQTEIGTVLLLVDSEGKIKFANGGWQTYAPDAGLHFTSSIGGGIVSGSYYDNSIRGAGYSTVASAAGQIKLGTFFVPRPLTIDRIGIEVTAAQTTGTDAYYVAIYEAGADGWPLTQVFISPVISGTTTLGAKEVVVAPSFTFQPGKHYYIGVHIGGNATLRSNSALGSQTLGRSAATGTTGLYTLLITQAITTPMPATWTFAAAQRNANLPITVLLRAA